MKQRALGYAAAAAAMMLLIGAPASAGKNTWVTDKGDRVHVGGHEAMFFGEGGTETAMEDLADGETRVIGEGQKQITASRRGDEVTLSRAADGGHEALDLTCTIGTDTCKVITFDDDPEKVMLIVQKTSVCKDGEGDCEDVDVIALGGHGGRHGVRSIHKTQGEPGEGVHVIKIKKTVECDDDGNCNEFEEVLGDGDDEMSNVIIETLGDIDMPGHHANMVFLSKGDQVTLRCAEGDTTMHVEPKEADQVFLCPKHSTPLEKAKSHPRMMRRQIKKDRSD